MGSGDALRRPDAPRGVSSLNLGHRLRWPFFFGPVAQTKLRYRTGPDHPSASPRIVAIGKNSRRCRSLNGMNPYLRSEEHTSELQSLMRSSYAVFCLKKKKTNNEK